MQRTSNKMLLIIIGLITAGLFYLLSPILTPFLAAALIAYLVDPIVERMTRYGIPRLLSVIVVFLTLSVLILLLFLLLIPLVQKQISAVIAGIPAILAWFQDTFLPWIMQRLDIQEALSIETVKASLADNWAKAGGVASGVVKTVLHSGATVVEWIANLVLIPVVTFYLLRDWQLILRNTRKQIPRPYEPTVVKLASECDTVLSAFFRGQLLVMLILGIIYALGLSMIGLQIGLVIGLVAGLVSIVPYLGFIVGIVAASIAAYVQFGTFSSVALVWVVFAIGQFLESTILTPKLVGDRIGLHPVAVIFAILAGGTLFGFFGVLLALPVAAVIMVCLRFLNRHYHKSELYRA